MATMATNPMAAKSKIVNPKTKWIVSPSIISSGFHIFIPRCHTPYWWVGGWVLFLFKATLEHHRQGDTVCPVDVSLGNFQIFGV